MSALWPCQRAAVAMDRGVLLVKGDSGTGKSYAAVERLVRLAKSSCQARLAASGGAGEDVRTTGVGVGKVLALAPTERGARRMRMAFDAQAPIGAHSDCEVASFHQFAWQVLQSAQGVRAGGQPAVTILGSGTRQQLLHRHVFDLVEREQEGPPMPARLLPSTGDGGAAAARRLALYFAQVQAFGYGGVETTGKQSLSAAAADGMAAATAAGDTTDAQYWELHAGLAAAHRKFASLKAHHGTCEWDDVIPLARAAALELKGTHLGACWDHIIVDDLHHMTPAMWQMLTALFPASGHAFQSLVAFADPVGAGTGTGAGGKALALGCDDGQGNVHVDWAAAAFGATYCCSPGTTDRWRSDGRRSRAMLACRQRILQPVVDGAADSTFRSDAEDDRAVQLTEYDSAVAEANSVAEQVQEVYASGRRAAIVGVRRADAALTLKMLHSHTLSDGDMHSRVILDRACVWRTLSPKLWAALVVRQAMSFMGALALPDEPWHLHALLSAPPTNAFSGSAFHLPPSGVAQLMCTFRELVAAAKAQRDRTPEGVTTVVTLRHALNVLASAPSSGLGSENHKRVVGIVNALERFEMAAATCGAAELVLHVLNDHGSGDTADAEEWGVGWPFYDDNQSVEALAMAQLLSLIEDTARFVCTSTDGVAEVALELLDLRRRQPHLSVSPPPSLELDTESDIARTIAGCTKSPPPVTVTTLTDAADWLPDVDQVFIVGCSKANVNAATRWPMLRLPTSARLVNLGAQNTMQDDCRAPAGDAKAVATTERKNAEELRDIHQRRMLHAVLARATSQAHFSFARDYGGKRAHVPCPLLVDALGCYRSVEVSTAAESPAVAPNNASGASDGFIAPQGPHELGVSAAKSPSHLRLSFSQIQQYRRCPRQYYMSRILGMETVPSPAMVYGSAMHAAVAALDSGQEEEAQLETVFCNSFDSGRVRAESVGNEARQYAEGLWQSLRSRGICGVRSFYERRAGNDGAERRATPVMVEAPFEVNLPEAGNCVSLSGIWDRVELGTSDGGTAKSARIVEFKSHTSASPTALLKPSAPGAARLQLLLYALAFERIHGAPPAKCVVEVIESGNYAELDCDLTPGSTDLQEALDVVSQVASDVRSGEFAPTPDFFACQSCHFRASCEHGYRNV